MRFSEDVGRYLAAAARFAPTHTRRAFTNQWVNWRSLFDLLAENGCLDPDWKQAELAGPGSWLGPGRTSAGAARNNGSPAVLGGHDLAALLGDAPAG